MTGPGKYDSICVEALEAAQAQCALLIILDGKLGNGFSVNFTDDKYARSLPAILRQVADQIEHEMRPLVIDDTTRARVAEVEAFAFANWYRPGQSKTVPGDDPRHTVELNTYQCVFSYTVASDESLWRQLSISVPSKNFPHPFAVFTIAELFGFTGWDGKTVKPPKDWLTDVNKTEHCIVVVQEVPAVPSASKKIDEQSEK